MEKDPKLNSLRARLSARMTPSDNVRDRSLQLGIQRAIEIAHQEGLRVGQIVAHQNLPTTVSLKEVDGDEGIVWWPVGDKSSIKRFPLDELFDPNVARDEAVKAVHELILKKPDQKEH